MVEDSEYYLGYLHDCFFYLMERKLPFDSSLWHLVEFEFLPDHRTTEFDIFVEVKFCVIHRESQISIDQRVWQPVSPWVRL